MTSFRNQSDRWYLYGQGWKLQDRYPLSFWDSFMVAAAKTSGCRFLLTEDLQNGQKLDGVEVVNPFRRRPASLSMAFVFGASCIPSRAAPGFARLDGRKRPSLSVLRWTA